ncbi:hypothetical protein GCM10011273_18470 [Asticcacaulis endophyticus]|uniref:Uncharacterized protein n=1 Tax=Asticcacaulis endophyticus TaxID=1395890 RepID=A0A918Q6G1_9CAUL|nr:hypothetical protein GCM10011273_18470 [Asticcacaulis endophyticus]
MRIVHQFGAVRLCVCVDGEKYGNDLLPIGVIRHGVKQTRISFDVETVIVGKVWALRCLV